MTRHIDSPRERPGSFPSLRATPRRRFATAAALIGIAAALACGDSPSGPGGGGGGGGARGTLTFSTPGAGDIYSPRLIQELDLASGKLTPILQGHGATRARNGGTAFLLPLEAGYYADHGVVVADPRGATEPPVYICEEYSHPNNINCGTPKLSPDGRYIAFSALGGWGDLCTNEYGDAWAWFVVVTDRQGNVVVYYEGFYDPEWLPDGRLAMMGSQCRNAGVWLTNAQLSNAARIDDGRVGTPGGTPAISPDGRTLAFVWNGQVWALPVDGGGELTQLTQLQRSAAAAAWSPDGRMMAILMFDVSMPTRAIALMRVGDPGSVTYHELSVYPYGPISWR